MLRRQLGFLRLYLFSCQVSSREEFKKILWPREHLYEHVHLYSVLDLLSVPSGLLEAAVVFSDYFENVSDKCYYQLSLNNHICSTLHYVSLTLKHTECIGSPIFVQYFQLHPNEYHWSAIVYYSQRNSKWKRQFTAIFTDTVWWFWTTNQSKEKRRQSFISCSPSSSKCGRFVAQCWKPWNTSRKKSKTIFKSTD